MRKDLCYKGLLERKFAEFGLYNCIRTVDKRRASCGAKAETEVINRDWKSNAVTFIIIIDEGFQMAANI